MAGKHTNVTKEEINRYVERMKECLKNSNYKIATNRDKNQNFINQYRLYKRKIKEILLSLDVTDFCYILDNNNIQYPDEKLYVFCKEYDLDNWGTYEKVNIYIKINIININNNVDYSIIISFHEAEKDIKYLFK